MMDEEVYWSMIEESLKATQDQEEQEQFLLSALKKMTPREMIGFHLTTVRLLNETYTSEMWCAGHIMNTGCSDDGFEDFRHWVVSRGREVYYKAKADPDTLIGEYSEDREEYGFEPFGYVAMEAYEEVTGEDLLDAIGDLDISEAAAEGAPDATAGDSPDAPSDTRDAFFTPIEFNWKSNDPESMRRICPRLYGKFRGGGV